MHIPGMPGRSSSLADSERNPYLGAVIVLLALALLGMVIAVVEGEALANPVLLDAAITLGLSSGILIGVVLSQTARARPPRIDEEPASPVSAEATEPPVPLPTSPADDRPQGKNSPARLIPTRIPVWIGHRLGDFARKMSIPARTGVAGLFAIWTLLWLDLLPLPLTAWAAGIAATLCLCAAALSATAVRYLADIDLARLPEGPGLTRGARVVMWIFVLAAVSMGLQWAGQATGVKTVHWVLMLINGALCYSLATTKRDAPPLDIGLLSTLGSRTNVLASILDAGQRQLGIDLRSTWALTVVRHSLEPLVIGLFALGWLSTALTVVGVDEQGLVERLGVPSSRPPLAPGIHVHLPWPVDRVTRIPVLRVQALTVGHEGQEEGGPEDVLWARQHAANEYTLLLGNGRDLITVDAAVQFRIADARAWHYHSQNPDVALRAIAYRAVMRNTVNHTLAEALSENVVATTARMRVMVQQDADALGLGVEVLGFTVGGMHPPVPVAPDYQAVISAELGKVTSVVNAQAYRNSTVPFAEALIHTNENKALAQGAEALARAAGEAWSFRTLQAQYRAAPAEYFFRRRLETLERNLVGRRFTIVDARFQRDGGELWVTP